MCVLHLKPIQVDLDPWRQCSLEVNDGFSQADTDRVTWA